MKKLSMARRQNMVVESGFLDLLGDDQNDFRPIQLDALAGTLASIAVDVLVIARDKLEQADQISSGFLADNIIPSEVEILGSTYKVEISLPAYYDFLNKGVKGWQNEKGGNSPYQFKKTKPSPDMVTAIRKWVIKEGLKGRAESRTKAITTRARKRASITEASTRTAYAISTAVKKKGLSGSGFWDATLQEVEYRMRNELGAALKIDIINNLSNKR